MTDTETDTVLVLLSEIIGPRLLFNEIDQLTHLIRQTILEPSADNISDVFLANIAFYYKLKNIELSAVIVRQNYQDPPRLSINDAQRVYDAYLDNDCFNTKPIDDYHLAFCVLYKMVNQSTDDPLTDDPLTDDQDKM